MKKRGIIITNAAFHPSHLVDPKIDVIPRLVAMIVIIGMDHNDCTQY
jgi:hypothetical protein